MSGGTTTVINATLAGIIKAAQQSRLIDKIYAGIPGVLGVLNDNIVELTELTEAQLELLKKTPSSCAVGTTRVKEFDDKELNIFKDTLKKYNISYFINIGGNGTIKQTKYLVNRIDGLKAISLPKTVDNDLGDNELNEMYFTPGFPSVVNYWIHKTLMLDNENLGAYSHDKVLIAQTFGRETGFIAGAARAADPERQLPLLILLPEDQRSPSELMDAIENKLAHAGRAIIVMSEGYHIGEVGHVKDYSGQVMFSSSKNLAAQLLVNECMDNNIQARAFIPGIDQRSEISFTTKYDTEHAYGIGDYAIKCLENGEFNFLAGIKKEGNDIKYHNIGYSSFANYSRSLDRKFIEHGSFDVSDSYLEYLNDVSRERSQVFGGTPLSKSSFFRL